MEEVENQGVSQEETQAQTEIAAPQAESEQDKNPQKADAQAIPNRAWAAMRKKNEDLERKSQMQDELLRQIMISQQKAPQAAQEEDLLTSISKEEYVPGEKVVKLAENLEKKFNLKVQEIELRYQNQQELAILSELKREHADFEDFVNPETLEILRETDPRRATALEHTADPYVRWATTYDVIKARGLVDKIPNAKQVKDVEQKIERNKKVVQSPQVYDKRPMAKAFDYSRMDKAMQEDLQKEMLRFGSMAGSVPNI